MIRKVFLLSMLIVVWSWACRHDVSAQDRTEPADSDISACVQEKSEQDRLITEAIEKQYNIRRIEISGNSSIRHREFTKRMATNFNEGDIFTREALEKSVKRISKMKAIYPISMKDLEVRLDPEYKDVDFLICVKQRPRK